jgi:hypothetical protein
LFLPLLSPCHDVTASSAGMSPELGKIRGYYPGERSTRY